MTTVEEIGKFTASQLCDFVEEELEGSVEDVHEITESLRSNKITGKAFLTLDDDEVCHDECCFHSLICPGGGI